MTSRAQRKAALLAAFRRVYAVEILRFDWEHAQTISIAVLSSTSCRPCGYRADIRVAGGNTSLYLKFATSAHRLERSK